MTKKTFTVCKTKVTITYDGNFFNFKITDAFRSYLFRGMETIEEVTSNLHKAASTNSIGRALATKALDWYYTEIGVPEDFYL